MLFAWCVFLTKSLVPKMASFSKWMKWLWIQVNKISFTRSNNSTFFEILSHCKLWKDQVAHLWDAFLFFLCPMSHQTKWGAMYCFTDAHPFLQVKLEDFSSIVWSSTYKLTKLYGYDMMRYFQQLVPTRHGSSPKFPHSNRSFFTIRIESNKY